MREILIDIAVVLLALFFGALVLCFAGFGIAIASSPFLLLTLDPKNTVVIINTVSLAVFLLLIFQNRKEIDYGEMRFPIIFGLLGVPFGLVFFEGINNILLGISISILIICSGAFIYYAKDTKIELTRTKFYMISFVVGTLLTSTGIGGPLMAVAGLSKNWTKNEIRGSLSLYYIFVEGAAVIGYLYTGSFEREVSLLVLVGLFPSICGFLIASYLANKSTEEVYKKALLGVIILSGIVAFLTQTASFLNI